MTRPRGAVLLCTLTGLIVGGCTHTPSVTAEQTGLTTRSSDHPPQSMSTSWAATPAPLYPLPTGATPNNSSKAHHVAITTCAPLKTGGHTAQGTAHNVGAKTEEYDIVVYFTDQATHKPVNWATTTLAVPPGKTLPWVAEKAFTAPPSLTCEIRSVS